ncbi:hypothetical protein EDD37DRAFT_634766 [Exophiala viscosa]|uniref:uncharacterized protein n=1 Tax=Exophiala viscosa TaxID=2486360 RepID=UPI00219D9871|nr:hypothetical protein EDD37DRAFT_634766 [Exophiala viscosa]
MVSTKTLGIPSCHALVAVKKRLSLSLTRCDECLLLKEAEQFDLSQFGTGGTMYELLRSLDWVTFRQSFGPHLPVKEPERRVCLPCRFRTTREAQEIGWIREIYEPHWQIICSGCSRREFFLNSQHTPPTVCDCTGDHACWETPHVLEAFGVYAQTGRMLSGKLCTRCFVNANAKWFARKQQLKAEIAERERELWSMDKEDEGDEEGCAIGGQYW